MKNIYRILAAVCGIAAAASIIWLAKYLLDIRRAGDQQEELIENYIEEPVPEQEQKGPTPEEMAAEAAAKEEAERAAKEKERQELLAQYEVPVKKIDFEAMQREQNEDIYAWITIPDTRVDYPILQHPEELDYYLDHNMDGSKGYPGCIYSQIMNSKDFTDSHTVIYGHNMKDGGMFANLHYYEDPEFFEAHPYFYIYTEDKVFVYEVLGAYEFSGVHLLMGFDISTPESFERFVKNIFNAEGLHNHFREELEPELNEESRILTLSTCISGKEFKRWLVTGVLKAEIDAEGYMDEAG